MWILIAALPVWLLVGLLMGGSFVTLPDLSIKLWPLAIPALVAAALIAFVDDPPMGRFLLPLSLLLFAGVVFTNLHIVGMAVVGVGIIANLSPVLLNGDMPVRESAVIGAGIATNDTIDFVELGAGRRFEEADDLLKPLGAIVPVRPLKEVFTFGDLIVLLGLINVGVRLVRPLQSDDQPVMANAPILDLRDRAQPRPKPVDEELPAFVTSPGAEGLARPVANPHTSPTIVEGSASWD